MMLPKSVAIRVDGDIRDIRHLEVLKQYQDRLDWTVLARCLNTQSGLVLSQSLIEGVEQTELKEAFNNDEGCIRICVSKEKTVDSLNMVSDEEPTKAYISVTREFAYVAVSWQKAELGQRSAAY